MDKITHYTLNLEDNKSLILEGSRKIIFLCGVVFDEDSDRDKRAVLKKYLLQNPTHHPLILEEWFGNLRLYDQINLHNLYDVETLVACFANATIIIHESISTGSELGMLATNKSTASKLLVLYPDKDSIEESKISKFVHFAFYGGKQPVLNKEWATPFYPAIKKSYHSNDRYAYHTIFPDNLNSRSYARDKIDNFLSSPGVQLLQTIKFVESRYNIPSIEHLDVVDYYIEKKDESEDETLCIYMSPMALRELLFGLVTIEGVQERVEASTSISEVMSVLEKELECLLRTTFSKKLGLEAMEISVKLKSIELSTFQDKTTGHLRKAVGLFIYLMKTMDYLSIEENLRFKFKRDFNTPKAIYHRMVAPVEQSAFREHMEQDA